MATPVEPTTRDHLLVWGSFLVPLLSFLAAAAVVSVLELDRSAAPTLVPLFAGVYGLLVSGASLWTGFFVYRPVMGGELARTTHRSEQPVWYALHVLGFGAFGVWGLVSALQG